MTHNGGATHKAMILIT